MLNCLKRFSLLALVVVSASAAAVPPGFMSVYRKAEVQPVKAQLVGKDVLQISFRLPAVSGAYPGGVNYWVKDGVLNVVIQRCIAGGFSDKCDPMVKAEIPKAEEWRMQVQIPYHKEKVVMGYSDGQEQVYP